MIQKPLPRKKHPSSCWYKYSNNQTLDTLYKSSLISCVKIYSKKKKSCLQKSARMQTRLLWHAVQSCPSPNDTDLLESPSPFQSVFLIDFKVNQNMSTESIFQGENLVAWGLDCDSLSS